MKLLLTVLITLSSVIANASQLPENSLSPSTLIKEFVMSGNLMPGPGPARKVSSSITFVVETCRQVSEQNFQLHVDNQRVNPGSTLRGISTVTLGYTGGVFADCFGPTHQTEITLETNQIPPYASIKLGNSLLVETHYVH